MAAEAQSKDQDGRFLLVYGSETGQAKAIAEIIRDKAIEKGLCPVTVCFSQYDKGVGLTCIPTYTYVFTYATCTCVYIGYV